MPFYQKGDVRIHYEEAGSGFPLLVIPGGVSYRSTGAGDCLRMVLNLHEPIFKVFKDEDHTSETTYTVKRHNGPSWSAPSAPPANSKVIEKLYI